MKLIENWHRAHRFLSVQLTMINGSAVAGWATMPQDWRDAVPRPWLAAFAVAMLVLIVISRVIDQGVATAPQEGPKP